MAYKTILQQITKQYKTNKMKKFNNINTIVNANAIEMTDGSKWITWYIKNINRGVSKNRLETIAHIITQ